MRKLEIRLIQDERTDIVPDQAVYMTRVDAPEGKVYILSATAPRGSGAVDLVETLGKSLPVWMQGRTILVLREPDDTRRLEVYEVSDVVEDSKTK